MHLKLTVIQFHFFDKLFTNELWDLLVTETNRYARQNNVNNWQDTNLQEMRCFIGFLYGTSINKISQLDDVWSNDWVLASPAFAKFFTRDRFWALFSNIHLADNAKAVDRSLPGFDKLYKIRPMISILKNSFQENYNLGQNVSVDDAMVKGKGRNPVKQYMLMKPIKGVQNCSALDAPVVPTFGTFKSTQERNKAMQRKTFLVMSFVICVILP